MKTLLLLPVSIFALISTGFTQQVLREENFDEADGVTYYFPPAEGQDYKTFSKTFAAWSNNDGQIALTPTEKAGEDGTGGLVCKVARPPAPGGYLSASCMKVNVPVKSVDDIADAISALEVDFSIKAPTGTTVDLFLQVAESMYPADPALKENIRARVYSSRGPLPKISGTDEYAKYTVKCGATGGDTLAALNQLCVECFKSGATELNLTVTWLIAGPKWPEGSEFDLDNIKISTDR